MLICLKRYTNAIDAGKLIKEAGIEFDLAYTSVLETCYQDYKLGSWKSADQLWVPVEKNLAFEMNVTTVVLTGFEQSRSHC